VWIRCWICQVIKLCLESPVPYPWVCIGCRVKYRGRASWPSQPMLPGPEGLFDVGDNEGPQRLIDITPDESEHTLPEPERDSDGRG
jgi:hypothetical protein